MPSFSQPSGDEIGPNFSFEEERKGSCLTPTNNIYLPANAIDHVALEQERLVRTNDVRERLGPLIERLKDSVKNIQVLENSIQISSDGDRDCKMNRKSLSPGSSRKLMNQSMEMVKKKMFRLKIMEEELATSEDRHLSLHNYFQQQSSQLQTTEARNDLPKENLELPYQNHITNLEEEVRLLKEKSVVVDDLRMQNQSLSGRAKYVKQLEHELEVEKSLRRKLELNLVEHQFKMNEQAVKYDCLHCKFETLTSIIAALKENFRAQENEIIDTVALHEMYPINTTSPQKTMIDHSETNGSTTLTEPLSLSWTESSISNHDDASTLDNDDSNPAEESRICMEDTTTCFSTAQILRAKIDDLNRENAELRESTSHALNKYKSLHEEMRRQSSMIEDLHQKLY